MRRKPRIFVSYARKDSAWLKLLDPWLKGLEIHADVESYDDRQNLGGDEWDARLKENLERADIFLALVTTNFIASEYIHEVELPIARRRHEEGTCVIMPIWIEHCHHKLLRLSNVNFLPHGPDGHLKPLEDLKGGQRKAALTEIIQDLEAQVQARAARADSGAKAGSAGIDLVAYRRRAQAKWSAIALASLAAPGAVDADITIRLSDVFVLPNVRRSRPPMTLTRDYLLKQGIDPDKEEAAAEGRAQAWERTTPEPAPALIADPNQRKLVVPGDPGAGKSSLTRYVLLRLLAETADPTSPLVGLHGHLPLLVELRDFVLEESAGRCGDLLGYLDYCGRSLGFGFTAATLEQHLQQNPGLLIVDGLDEIFDPARRKQMAEQIIGLTIRYPSLRVLVTSRIAGFDEHPFRAAEFDIATLSDLTQEQITGVTKSWFAFVFPGDPATAERTRDDLRQTIERRPQLRVLASNPMILTIMATIARHKPLARSRAALYAQALELLCHNWDYRRGLRLPVDSPLRDLSASDTPLMLRQIAWRMQEAKDGVRANAISRGELQGVLESFFRDDWHFEVPKVRRATEEMLQRLQERNWVLTLRGPDLFGFVHRTFLEYLCATELAERFKAQSLDVNALIKGFATPRLGDDSWHEVHRLPAGSLPETAAEEIVLAIVPTDEEVVKNASRLGLAWQVLAEVEPRRIPSLTRACQSLTDSLDVFLKGSMTSGNRARQAIAGAAESIGSIAWPTPHPPHVPWPERATVLPYTHPYLITALGLSVWNCRPQTKRHLETEFANKPTTNRGSVLRCYAAAFKQDEGTRRFITDAANDPEPDARGDAIEALAEHFHDQPDTANLTRDRAVNDPDSGPRRASCLALAGLLAIPHAKVQARWWR